MAKKNFDENKKLNFVLIYKIFIKGSLVVVFDIYVFANINLMRKKDRK